MSIYITIYTKEEGKQELTYDQWFNTCYTFRRINIYHREDGPAIEYSSGSKNWYINGVRHREDGPAREHSNVYGNKEWYIAGEYYSEADHNKLLEDVDLLEPILGLIDPREWVRKRFEKRFKDVSIL